MNSTTAVFAVDNENPFQASFHDRILSFRQDKYGNPPTCGGINIAFQLLDKNHHPYGFGSPSHTRPARFEDNSQPFTTWDTLEQNRFHQHPIPPRPPHVLSPPKLAKGSPQKCLHNELENQLTVVPPRSALAFNHPNESYAQHISEEYQHHPNQQIQPREGVHSEQSMPIRKRTPTGNDAAQPAKRSRKSTSRTKGTIQSSNPLDPDNLDDEKRAKFLERNRVAASKCRQKKKDWMSNLEAHARELQKDKTQLALMASSLKEEVMWLKCEIFKHTGCSCGCRQVRDFLNQESNNLAHPTNRDYRPFGSAPSPHCPVGAASSSLLESVSCRASENQREGASQFNHEDS
ncbi:MAG: hypothetical protein MMC33_009570 [Icmadophila ericetorum]|nr:hypothetical protein [Icmadophila ericetorum]